MDLIITKFPFSSHIVFLSDTICSIWNLNSKSYLLCYPKAVGFNLTLRLKKKCLCLIVLSYVCVYICVRSSALEWRALHGKKRDLDPLELQVVVSHFVMVGTELGTSARAVCTFNCWIFPPTRPWDFCWGYGSLNAFLKCFWTNFFTCGDMMSWYKQGRKKHRGY